MNKPKNHYFKNRGFKLLKLDSDLFGFKVAKISKSSLSPKELRLVLNKLKALNVRLVYWQSSSKVALKQNGLLCNKQVTYLLDLKKLTPPPKKDREIKVYRAKTPTKEMKNLAIQIGNLSRFNRDPKLPKKLFHKLYHLWIKNSVNGTAADKVFVTKDKNKITGLITLGTKNRRGDIKLLAVAKNSRGKKLGTKLVTAAQKYFLDKGYTKMQVVTQRDNTPACLLYEKCGFHQEKAENFYHFWL